MNEVGGGSRSATEISTNHAAAFVICARPGAGLNAGVPFHFQFRRYRIPLRNQIRTAQEVWAERKGLIVRLADDGGRVGFGEVAPIPAFGTETVEQAEAACVALGEWPSESQLDSLPMSLACTRGAVRAALGAVVSEVEPVTVASELPSDFRAVAALLPAGRAAIEAVGARIDTGFRVFKWKVGVGDVADELAILDDICATLPSGAKLRLDANGSWDRRQAERWLERCAERPIEFVEQPSFASHAEGEKVARRTDDLLLGLAHDFPTPIALDESLVSDGDAERWLGAGWPGWFVVKPSLLADVAGTLAKLEAAKAHVVFSSALETAVGAKAALGAAFGWRGESKALGFGVWPLFADTRFNGPAAAPFIRREDVNRLDAEAVWNALS